MKKKKKNNFLEGSIIATTAILITKFLGVIYVIPFYAIIGQSGATLYSYAYAVYMVFLNISSAGIPSAMSKIVSEYDAMGKKKEEYSALKLSVLIVSVLSITSFLLLMIFSKDIARLIIGNKIGGNNPREISLVIRAIATSILVIPFLSISKGYLQGHKRINVSSFAEIIEQLVRIFVVLIGSFVGIKILGLDVSFGVSIALLGSFVGGLIAFLFILKKIGPGLKDFKDAKVDKSLDIVKKIIRYSLPFIVISITSTLFNVVDMMLLLRGLGSLGYSGVDSEFVASVITTWGDKFNVLINSFAVGIIISLIPNLVSSYTLNKMKEANDIMNKAFQMVIYVSIPLVLVISLLSMPLWNAFYSTNSLGPNILRVSILTSVFCNIYLIYIQIASSLSEYKTVYKAVVFGLCLNGLCDIPLMYLCNYLHLPAYYGASISTICGYLLSSFIVYRKLKKIDGINFKETIKLGLKVILATIVMLLSLFILGKVFVYNGTTKLYSMIYFGVFAAIGGAIYLFLTIKMNILYELFGKDIWEKLMNKFRLKKKA